MRAGSLDVEDEPDSEGMNGAIAFPDSLKADLLGLATAGGYERAREILARSRPGELVLESRDEAQVVVDVARLEMMRTLRQCPFWDEEDPRHDPAHAERFHEVVNGLFEKTVSCIAEEFDVVTAI